MPLGLAARAVAALVAGVLLGDCVLLAGGLLLWTAHLHGLLNADSGADRTHTWLRCVGQGAALIALGLALAANTLAVVLGLWGERMNTHPWFAAAILLLLALPAVPAPARRSLHRALLLLALLALLAPSLAGAAWAPCVFAGGVALFALGNGGYRLGPMARRLAEPGHLR
jgi:hypothetical protein